jgi:hypothetical protein
MSAWSDHHGWSRFVERKRPLLINPDQRACQQRAWLHSPGGHGEDRDGTASVTRLFPKVNFKN